MRTKEFYLTILGEALIEIRALAVEGNLELGPKLADMLHNVPAALRYPWTEERDEELYEQIRSKAEIYGVTAMLDSWERSAARWAAQRAGESQEINAP
jgi:hypothetical protein